MPFKITGFLFFFKDIAGGKKRAPPKAEKLVEFHKDIVKKTTDKYPAHPLILAGKSMGSRYKFMGVWKCRYAM
jgi:hypothetical protein